jgi:starch phosphorylase
LVEAASDAGDDRWLVAAFRPHLKRQGERAYPDSERCTRMPVLNTAPVGRFSSDRAFADYCREVWRVGPGPRERQSEAEIGARQ